MFCSICVTATNQGLPKPTMARQIDSFRCFLESGFNNWKKALYTFQSHERSDLHRASVAVFKASGKETVSSLLEAGKVKQMKENSIALAVLFTSIRYLGRQGLAVRGHTKENSNFEVLLDERRNDVPELDSWLKREEQYKWLCPKISNKILLDFGHAVLRRLTNQVKLSEYYGIIMDETSDVSGKEQISVCLRIAYEDLSIEEIFFGLYETSINTSDALFTIFKDLLLRMQLDINKCRGQCYDGAANVSDHVAGLRSKVLEKKSRALYVHCRAHKLNLTVQDDMNNNEEIRNIMVLVKELTAFIWGSP